MIAGTGCGESSELESCAGNRVIRIERIDKISMSVSGGVEGYGKDLVPPFIA